MNYFQRSVSVLSLLLAQSVVFYCTAQANAAASGAAIYWADSGTIWRAELDGSSLTNVVSGIGSIGDFAIDTRTNLVYMNDGFNIYRSNLDGSNFISIFQFPPFSYRADITIDPLTNQLFFADGRNNIVYRSNLDGSGAVTVIPANGTPANGQGIRELWLDSSAGKLYWNNASTFHRTNLDGSQDEVLFTSTAGIGDFEIDPQQGKVYWTTVTGAQNGGTVRRANLDGTSPQILVAGLWGPGGVALDLPHGKIYYTDAWSAGPTNYASTIRMANLDGTSQQTLLDLGPSAIRIPSEITVNYSVPEPNCCSLVAICSLLALKRSSRRS